MDNKLSEKWPNFFIVGAPKAGTTSLYYYLNKVPEIFMSTIKEPGFFSASAHKYRSLSLVRNKEKYLELFLNAKNEKIIGEATPSYLSDPKAAPLIFKNVPQAKILISLRDPVERSFSDYFQLKRKFQDENISFSNIIRENFLKDDLDSYWVRRQLGCTRGSLYAEAVKRYIDLFGKNNVKIIFFENLVETPKSVVEEILEFLEIKNEIYNFKEEVHNPYFSEKPRGNLSKKMIKSKFLKTIAGKVLPSSTRQSLKYVFLSQKETKKPSMLKEDIEYLKEFFTDDVQNLKDILKCEFPWKNFK